MQSSLWVAQVVVVALVGLALGSFLLTVVDRHHAGTSWVRGRSRCDRCRRQLGWYEVVPVISFVWLRGRCKGCRGRIAVWHVGAEVLLASLFIAVLIFPFALGPVALVWQLLASAALFLLFVYDVRFGELPDVFVLPMIVGAGAWAYVSGWPLLPTVGAAALGGIFFAVQWGLSRGRWVGNGDVRLGFLLGLLVGWPYILLALLVAYVGGSAIAIVLLLAKTRTLKDKVPMGAFLIPAAFVVLWWGPWLLDLFWQLS